MLQRGLIMQRTAKPNITRVVVEIKPLYNYCSGSLDIIGREYPLLAPLGQKPRGIGFSGLKWCHISVRDTTWVADCSLETRTHPLLSLPLLFRKTTLVNFPAKMFISNHTIVNSLFGWQQKTANRNKVFRKNKAKIWFTISTLMEWDLVLNRNLARGSSSEYSGPGNVFETQIQTELYTKAP